MSTAPGRGRSGIPKQVGKYEIRDELGKGGFGRVYLGFDPTVGRLVAIKVLSAGGDPSLLARFRTEASAAGNLHHKNIVTIHEFGEDQGTFYLVMEYLEGRDLQHVIAEATTLTLVEKMRIMTQVAEGLHCAHQGGIVHRDVKPANIMLLRDGSVKVMDFGIAKLTSSTSAKLTQKGLLIGTVSYMAPEQFNGVEADALCDIWSFGTICYELMCGVNPFDAPEATASMYRIMHLEPAPIKTLLPECPEPLANAISRLLSKNREGRYQNFEDVLFDTAPILSGLESLQATELVSQAKDLIRGGGLDEAQALVKRVLALDPSNREGRILRQGLQIRMNQRSARVRAQSLIDQSEKAAADRNFAGAIEAIEAAIRLDSPNASLPARLAEFRAAKERLDLAQLLVASARKDLELNNLTAAFRSLTEALTAEPENPDAQNLLRDVQASISEREYERRLREGLNKAKELIALESFDEAIESLESLARETSGNGQVQEALDHARVQREAYNRERSIQSEIEAAKIDIKNQNFEAAIFRLEPLADESSCKVDIAELLAYSHNELESERRLTKLEAMGREAWTLCKAKKFDSALTQVESALQAFPDDGYLINLRQAILAESAQENQLKIIDQALEESAVLERAGRLEDAVSSIMIALGQCPDDAGLKAALELIQKRHAEQQEFERLSALQRDLAQANFLLDQGQAVSAIQLLEQMRATYPGDTKITDLISRALAEQQRRTVLDALLAEIRQYLDAKEADTASEALARARKQFGLEPQLIALGVEATRMQSRQQAIGRASVAFRERSWRRAANALEAILKEDATDSEARSLLERTYEEEGAERRSRRCAEGRKEAENLFQSHKFDEAIRCLSALHNEFPADSAIRDDLTKALDAKERHVRREAYVQGRQRTDALVRAGQFNAAIAEFEKLLGQFPDDLALKDDLKSATEAKQDQQRRECYVRERRRASESVQSRKFEDAIRVLQALLADFPKDPAIEEDLKSARGAKDLQERSEALDREVGQMEKLYRKGDAQAVKERANLLPPDLADARVRELLKWAEREIALLGEQKARESAESLWRKRRRRIAFTSVGATLIVGMGWVSLARFNRPASVATVGLPQESPPVKDEPIPPPTRRDTKSEAKLDLKTKVSEISQDQLFVSNGLLSFSSKAGGPGSSQTLSIGSSHGTKMNWSAEIGSGDWLSVVPKQGMTPADLMVSVDPRHLTVGEHSARVIFSTAKGVPSIHADVQVMITAPDPEPVPINTPPPSPPIVNCRDPKEYHQLPYGEVVWQGATLPPEGVLVIGPGENLLGGHIERGKFPGCPIAVTSLQQEIEIGQQPSVTDYYRRVQVRNKSNMPVTRIALHWTVK